MSPDAFGRLSQVSDAAETAEDGAEADGLAADRVVEDADGPFDDAVGLPLP
jgi:hypothetical protein